jgi:hypothetical protein
MNVHDLAEPERQARVEPALAWRSGSDRCMFMHGALETARRCDTGLSHSLPSVRQSECGQLDETGEDRLDFPAALSRLHFFSAERLKCSFPRV